MTIPNTDKPRPAGTLHPRVTNMPLDLHDVIMEDIRDTLWSRGLDYVDGQEQALSNGVRPTLSAQHGKVYVVGTPPGGGKSTLIRSSLKAFAREFSLATPIAESLGGVVVVVETIKEARELLKLCESVAPGMARLVESPNAATLEDGCVSGLATKPSECPGRACPDADRCPILNSARHMNETPILIITHARYKFYMEDFTPLRDWNDASGAVHTRNLILIDEAPVLVEKNELSPSTVHKLVDPFSDPRRFRSFNFLERQLWHNLLKPFNKLRQNLTGNTVFQTISKADLREEYFTKLEVLENSIRECATKPWYAEQVISAFQALHGDGQAYHYKSRGQVLLSPRVKQIHGEDKPATVIFTGTADLNPVLAHNEHFNMVDSAFPVNGSRLTLHIQRGDAFTFSKSAAENRKNQVGCLAWTERRLRELQARHSKALVVTYQDYADKFWNELSPKFPGFLVPFKERDGSSAKRVPYFGGMNGSNLYGSCTGMVIAGLHRFRPEDYLAEAVAVASVSGYWGGLLSDAGNNAAQLITLMQDILLANDLVQAIFRTDMRNHGSNKPVEVWLLQPSDDVVRYLLDAFPGCRVLIERDFPPEIILASIESCSYDGKTPHYAKLLPVLYALEPGTCITPEAIYARAHLTPAEYKEAKRNKLVKAYFADHVNSEGRGGNTVYRIVERNNA